MNYPVVCEYCGGRHLRRSRRQTTGEAIKMLFGTYPFRCHDCNGRFSVNVFLLSRLAYAKCPKCLSLDVSNVVRGRRPSSGQRTLMTFGARKVRCRNCRYMFVSFRPVAQPGKIDEVLDEDVDTPSDTDIPLPAESEPKADHS